MPEQTHAEKIAACRAQAAKALIGHPRLAEIQATNFDRISAADLTDLGRRLGGLVA